MEHKIEILSSEISNKIAAGEVVQRPLSVVKELVENSIDAKSSKILISLQNSGLDEIEVLDDGIGMNKENLEICLLRHATSKVKNEQDIYNIMTLGFRGEALPSIAAVSIFNLKTSVDGKVGYELIKEGDQKQVILETATNKGTKISIKNLFFNTPARFKHLSSTFYELSLIIQYVNKAALTNPNIKFELRNNSNVVFASLGDGNIVNVMQKIYSTEIAKNILEFQAKNDDFQVKFYIVKPQITRSKKNNMHISVNNRIIRNIAIENMIIKGYGTYLHTNQFPIVFLDIITDFSLIDINIHPTKEQIKISLIDKLEELIINSIKEALNKEEYISKPEVSESKLEDILLKNEDNLLNTLFSSDKLAKNSETFNSKKNNIEKPQVEEIPDKLIGHEILKGKIENEPMKEIREKESIKEERSVELNNKNIKNLYNLKDDIKENYNSNTVMTLKEEIKPFKTLKFKENDEQSIAIDKEFSNDGKHDKSKVISDIINNDIFEKNLNIKQQTLITNGKYVGNHHNTYIMYENEEGLYLIDQHAAQERIRYESILEKLTNKEYKLQNVLVPQTFEFTQDEFILIKDKLEPLRDLGLIFENFGPNTIRLVEVDSFYLKVSNMKKQLRWIIDTVIHEKKLSYEQIVDEIAISMACKGAIKAHDYITQDDAEILLYELSNCKVPYTCPHGRPVIVLLSNYQVEKMFKRVF